MVNCSLGDDGVHSYEDTCNFTCNTGYELTGSSQRICQSNGSWSDTGVMCRRGRNVVNQFLNEALILLIVFCSSLANPNNGMISCSLGDDGVYSYEDICNFTCNTGYELTGSDTRTCQSDGSWSGSKNNCTRGKVKLVH